MDEVFLVVQTPIFWFGTVFIGLLLSVFGAAVYDWLKIQVGKFSSRQRKRNEEEKARIEQEARRCARSTKLIVLRRGTIDDLDASALAMNIIGLASVLIGVAYLSLPGFFAAFNDPQRFLQSGVLDLVFGIPAQDLIRALSEGWYPLQIGRSFQLTAAFFIIAGYYLVIKTTQKRKRVSYWQRVLYRAGQLIEEDLESNAPDTDA